MKPTPIYNNLVRQGVTVFLYFGELSAMRGDGSDIPEATVNYIRENKETIIAEIRSITAPGEKISFDKILEDRLHDEKCRGTKSR